MYTYNYSYLRTLKKALISTGVFLATAAGLATATALQNYEALTGLWAETGPLALIAVPLLVFGGRQLEDWLKHRNR